MDTLPITIASKKIKTSRINIKGEVKDLYTKNFKSQKKEIWKGNNK